MAMTKMEILLKMGEVDDKILELCKDKPKIHPEKLTKKELEEALRCFEGLYEYTKKCIEAGKKNED